MKVNNTPQQSNHYLAEAKEQRLDQVQEALDDRSVQLTKLSGEDRAANRSYGSKMVSDIDDVQSTVPSCNQQLRHTRNDNADPLIAEFFGSSTQAYPGVQDCSTLMIMWMMEQYMMMMLMMMAMMEGGQMPQPMPYPMPGPWGEGGACVDDINGGQGYPDVERPREPGEDDNSDRQMTPVRASRILQHYFDLVDTAAGIDGRDGIIGKPDLEAVAGNPDAPEELKEAVAYILRNPMVLNAIDVGAGNGKVDNVFNKQDLAKFIEDHSGKDGYDIDLEDRRPQPKPQPKPQPGPSPEPKPDDRAPDVEDVKPPTPDSNAAELRAQQDATRIHEAVEGLGTDEDALIQVLGGRTNEDIQLIKKAYVKSYGRQLEEVVQSETSGDFGKLLLALLNGRAPESAPVDRAEVQRDVEALHEAMDGLGTDEDTLISILSSRSKKHLAEVKRVYKETYGEELSQDVDDDTSGDFRRALLQNL